MNRYLLHANLRAALPKYRRSVEFIAVVCQRGSRPFWPKELSDDAAAAFAGGRSTVDGAARSVTWEGEFHWQILLTAKVSRRIPGVPSTAKPHSRYCLRVQADELTVPVLLNTRRSSHLPTCRDRNRTRRHQNQIRDAEAVRI